MPPPRASLLWAAVSLFWLGATAPAQAASEADRQALKQALRDVLEREPLKGGKVSMHLQSLDDGSVVFTHNSEALLNPASNVKLVTAAAALVLLGPEYRFETEFLGDPALGSTGKIKTLFVRGKGDPSITTERLFGMVSELLHAGVREVQDIVVDDSWFDPQRTAPGFDQEDTDRSYMAPTGALSLNWNAVGVYLRPGAAAGAKPVVEVEPASEFFIVESSLSTGTRRNRRVSVTSSAAGDKQRLVVKGVVPVDGGALSVWKKIDSPSLYFGHTLRQLLTQRGVKVKGKVKQGLVGSGARLIHVAQSETFDIVLKRMNKLSSNFVAEQLIKTLGAETRGVPGSFAQGIDAVEGFLSQEVGIPRGTYVMKNGSGLNDTNRFSAAQLNRILRYMYERFPLSPEYLSSLGIAGKDGTLRYRFEGSDAVGRLRAKTGTLENVSALSGYVQSAGGEKFSFAMMVNDYHGRSGPVVRGLDSLGQAVASVGSKKGPTEVLAAISQDALALQGRQEVNSRIKTYLSLGRQQDPRNIGFLRTAWRNEKDLCVRAVLAESIYQSNPQDFLGARVLLDSVSAGEEVYGRLRKVARELAIEVPGVGSLVELAAGGHAEALARVLELSRPASLDETAQAEIALALSEIGRTAPDELVLALKDAPVADRTAATLLLAEGLTTGGEAAHPFWKALRKSLGASDPSLAAFARELESSLSRRVAERKAPALQVAPAGTLPVDKKNVPATAETRPGG